MAQRRILFASALALGLAAACGQDLSQAMDDAGDQGVGATSGTGGSSNGSGGTTMNPPPEQEVEDSYTAPVVSGRWIWTANPESGRVALIDAERLRISTAEAGLGPTYVTALGASSDSESAAVVLNVGSNDASILRAQDGVIDVAFAPVHSGANRLTASADGRWVIVWTDAALIPNADPTEGMQDVTVLDLTESPVKSRRLTVGYRPNRVLVGEGAAYIVTEPGVSVIELPEDGTASVLRDVPVTADATEAATARDVTVTRDGRFAFVRRTQSPVVQVVSLDDATTRTITLPDVVTDLDLSPDGTLAFAVVRGQTQANPGSGGSAGTGGGAGVAGTAGSAASSGTAAVDTAGAPGIAGEGGAGGFGGSPETGGHGGQEDGEGGSGDAGALASGAGGEAGGGGGEAAGAGTAGAPAAGGVNGEAGAGGTPSSGQSYVAILEVPEIFADPDSFELVPIADFVGSVAVAPEGDRAVLFTTSGENDRLTILDLKTRGMRTAVVKAPVKAVFPTSDGEHAVVLLSQAAGSQKPGGFSLVPLKDVLPPKIVGTDVPPLSVGIGAHEGLVTITGTDAGGKKVHGVYLARFPELSSDFFTLASPPLSAALVPEANVGFVAQAHPEGRITFLDLEDGRPRTLTGFELSAMVVDE